MHCFSGTNRTTVEVLIFHAMMYVVNGQTWIIIERKLMLS